MELSYRSSLKSLEVEEAIDLLVHRPLGYVIARACYPTPITADALTIVSMLLGISAGGAFLSGPLTGTSHMQAGSVLLVLSAIFDCSDGQLARMRKTSSKYGRMLDGAVDAVVQISAVPAAVLHMAWRRGLDGTTMLWVLAAVIAIVTGLRHTTLYDHYKNVYVKNTDPNAKECDDYEDIEAEWQARRAKGNVSFSEWARFTVYRFHLKSILDMMRWIDPYIPAKFTQHPAYSETRAARFRSLNAKLMRVWSLYGLGTHIFLLSACLFFDRAEWYIVLRLVGFNAGLAVLIPLQRRASREFFQGESSSTAAVTA